MHSIKKAARREAWYQNDQSTYNPFGRVNPRPKKVQTAGPTQQTGLGAASYVRHSVSSPALATHTVSELASHEAVAPNLAGAELSRPATIAHSNERSDQTTRVEGLDSDHTQFNDHISDPKITKPKRTSTKVYEAIQRHLEAGVQPLKEKRNKYGPPPPFLFQLKAITYAWPNVLFAFVPIGFALNYARSPPVAIFVVNFLAILPCNLTLSFGMEELNLYVGDRTAGLLSMTTSNAAQLITSILLLKTGQIGVLRASLVGSILQPLLIMTGLAFLVGGIGREEQFFNARVAQTIGMLLLLAVLSLTIPTVSQMWVDSTPQGILSQSRGTAVVIMASYVLWIFFQLKTHRALFEQAGQKAPEVLKAAPAGRKWYGDAAHGMAFVGGSSAATGVQIDPKSIEEKEEAIEPHLSLVTAIVLIAIATTLLTFHTLFATNSIQGLMAEHGISNSFMGIVILPILSNDPEPLIMARRDKMDMCLSWTLERCMQTALMVVPLIVLIAWGMGMDDTTLDFDGFSVAALFASIVIVTYVVQEGKSNWLTGALLIKVFIIIGLASYYV